MPKRIQLIVSLLVILSGGSFWFLVNGAAVTGQDFLPFLSLVVLTLFFSFSVLSFVFLKARFAALNILVANLPILLILDNKLLALGIILFSSFFSIFPAKKVQKELQERVEFSISNLSHKALPAFLTVLAIAIAAFFYNAERVQTFEDVVPEGAFQKVMSVASRILPFQSYLPFEIPDPNKTVDELIMDVIRREGGETFDRLSQEEKEAVLREARSELARNLKTGNLRGDMKVGSIIYKNSIDVMEERFGGYKKYLPALFAFAVFAALRTLFILLGWISIAISWIVFKILLYIEVVKVSTRQVTQEIIEFN